MVSDGLPRPSGRRVVLLSTTALVTAALAATTLHELFHVVAHLALGSPALLLPNAVEAVDPLTPGQQAVTAINGPLASIAVGLLAYLAQRRVPVGYPRLLLLWLALTSAQIGVGYFVVAGALPGGDPGRAFATWGVPVAGYVAAAVAGLAGQLLLSALTAREVGPWLGGTATLRSWVVLPWLVGTAVLVALYSVVALATVDPDDLVAVIAGAATSTIFLVTTSLFLRRGRPAPVAVALGSPAGPGAGLAAAVTLVALLAAVGGVVVG